VAAAVASQIRYLKSVQKMGCTTLRIFKETGGRPLLVISGQAVAGIVTPADLNKIGARIYVYNLIGLLERRLADLIGRHFRENSQGILDCLPRDRQRKIREQLKQLKEGNVDGSAIELLYFRELLEIAGSTQEIWSKLRYKSATAFNNATYGLVEIRNATMHTVHPLLRNTTDSLEQFMHRIDRAIELLGRLETALSKSQTTADEGLDGSIGQHA